jgi:hypothetical protein
MGCSRKEDHHERKWSRVEWVCWLLVEERKAMRGECKSGTRAPTNKQATGGCAMFEKFLLRYLFVDLMEGGMG